MLIRAYIAIHSSKETHKNGPHCLDSPFSAPGNEQTEREEARCENDRTAWGESKA